MIRRVRRFLGSPGAASLVLLYATVLAATRATWDDNALWGLIAGVAAMGLVFKLLDDGKPWLVRLIERCLDRRER